MNRKRTEYWVYIDESIRGHSYSVLTREMEKGFWGWRQVGDPDKYVTYDTLEEIMEDCGYFLSSHNTRIKFSPST